MTPDVSPGASIIGIPGGAGSATANPARLPCVGCRYDLRGARADARCPECGLAVASTVATWPPEADPSTVPGLRSSAAVAAWSPPSAAAAAALAAVATAVGAHPIVPAALAAAALVAVTAYAAASIAFRSAARRVAPVAGGGTAFAGGFAGALVIGAGLRLDATPLVALGAVAIAVAAAARNAACAGDVAARTGHDRLARLGRGAAHAAAVSGTLLALAAVALVSCRVAGRPRPEAIVALGVVPVVIGVALVDAAGRGLVVMLRLSRWIQRVAPVAEHRARARLEASLQPGRSAAETPRHQGE